MRVTALRGGDHNDRVYGGSGDDSLDGGDGTGHLDGGTDTDTRGDTTTGCETNHPVEDFVVAVEP